MRSKIVSKIGINDYPSNVSIKGLHLPFYSCWSAMLKRVVKTRGYSKNTTICEDWKSLSNFKIWFDANYVEGFELDKDLLVPGNQHYSPDCCCFVSGYINNLIKGSRVNEGEYPQGVNKKREGVFCAQMRKNGKRVHIGYYRSVQAASVAYQNARAAHVAVELRKHKQEMPERLFLTLAERFPLV